MPKPIVQLKNWQFIRGRLHGNVHGHPKRREGERVITSRVVRVDASQGIVETKNTIYQLEERAD